MARAVLVAVVAPNVSSRRVGGSPIPGRVDGQPSPGTCVTAMADPWRSDPEPGSAGDDVIDFPTAHFGPCDGAVVGEVASIDTALPPERIDANDYQNAVAQCALTPSATWVPSPLWWDEESDSRASSGLPC